MNRVRQTLSGLTQESPASLRVYRPRPTAAFSPRDTVHLAYGEVTKNLVARGFTPAERGAGGQLAVYDEAALVIDLVAPHPQPRENTRDRFRLFADMLAAALRHIGVDARVGAVPGEYCPGDFSVNAGGTVKLAGLAQRVVKHGYHMGAVLSVGRSDAAREAVAEAYALMNIPFDPATFGSVAGCLGKMPTTVYTDIASAISVQLRQSQR
jgi:lipoate-protein ligase A